MAGNVRECFLDDSIHNDLDVDPQTRKIRWHVESHRDAGSLRKSRNERRQRRAQSPLIEEGWMEQVGNRLQLADRLTDQIPDGSPIRDGRLRDDRKGVDKQTCR